LINLFDPETIVIGGEGTAARDFIFPEMAKIIQESAVYNLDRKINILPMRFEDHLWVRGAATVVREVFKIH